MTTRWMVVVAALAAVSSAPGRLMAQSDPDHEAMADAAFDADEAADQEPEDEDESAEDKEHDAYDEGNDAIDEEEWSRAVRQFDRVIAMNGKRVDAALYWKAYALSREGRRSDALAAIAQLKAKAPQSRWLDDARALEIEIRKDSGQRPAVESQSDEEMKLIAINSLMHNNSEEAVPMLEKFLTGGASLKLKKKALFVLSQGGSPRAREVVTEIARGRRNPQLQSEALKYLGLFGGEQSRQALADIYASSSDVEVKKEILHALFIGGGVDQLAEALRTERDPSLRAAAIHSLGLAGGAKSAAVLAETYRAETDPEIRKKVMHALFLQGNAGALVQIARGETNPELRKSAVHWLSLMNSKEATAYMMEVLNK